MRTLTSGQPAQDQLRLSTIDKQLPLLAEIFGSKSPHDLRPFFRMLGLVGHIEIWDRSHGRVIASAQLSHAGPTPLNAYANAMADARWFSERACIRVLIHLQPGPVKRAHFPLSLANTYAITKPAQQFSDNEPMMSTSTSLLGTRDSDCTTLSLDMSNVVVKMSQMYTDKQSGDPHYPEVLDNAQTMSRFIALTDAHSCRGVMYPLYRVY